MAEPKEKNAEEPDALRWYVSRSDLPVEVLYLAPPV
jgi:hypothetical protein